MPREWTITVPVGWKEDPALSASILAEKTQQAPGAKIDVAAYLPPDGSGAMAITQIATQFPPEALAELEHGAHTSTMYGGTSVEYTQGFVGGQLVAHDVADVADGRVYSHRVFTVHDGKVLWVNAQCIARAGKVPACAEAVKTLAVTEPPEPIVLRSAIVGATVAMTIIAIAMVARKGGSRGASPAASRHREP